MRISFWDTGLWGLLLVVIGREMEKQDMDGIGPGRRGRHHLDFDLVGWMNDSTTSRGPRKYSIPASMEVFCSKPGPLSHGAGSCITCQPHVRLDVTVTRVMGRSETKCPLYFLALAKQIKSFPFKANNLYMVFNLIKFPNFSPKPNDDVPVRTT